MSMSVVNYEDYWSKEASLRRPSRLQGIIMGFAGASGVVGMHGGLPAAASFPVTEMSLTVKCGESATSVVHVTNPRVLESAQQYNMKAQGLPALHSWACKITAQQHHPPREVDVTITNGSTHSVETIMSLLLNPGDALLVEEFTWSHATESIFGPRMYDMLPVKLDQHGLDPGHLQQVMQERKAAGLAPPRVLYTIPTAQNPTGITTPTERKAAIYQVCREHGIIIVEDDAYYWLQYPDGPLCPPGLQLPPSFLSMDTDGRVVRIDTVAKLLGPGYRLGWVSAAPQMAAKIALATNASTVGPNSFAQVVVSEMLQQWGDSGFEAFLKDLQQRYASLAAAAQEAAAQHLQGLASWTPPTGGMFMWLHLHGEEDAGMGLMTQLVEGGVVVVPGGTFCVAALQHPEVPCPFIRVSFAAVTEEQLLEGFRCMGQVLRARAAKTEALQGAP